MLKREALPQIFEHVLHLRTDLHLARKLWHMGTGLLVVFTYLYTGMSPAVAIVILGTVLGLDLLVETARLKIPAFNEKVLGLWGPLMRTEEANGMSSTPYYLGATILAIAIFPKPVAILSILYLACGDPVASLFGILYGKNSIRLGYGKSLVGCLAGSVTCFAVTFVFLKALGLADWGTVLFVSVLGGLAGGFSELVPFELDDNFTIPVVSGFVLWLVFIAAGI